MWDSDNINEMRYSSAYFQKSYREHLRYFTLLLNDAAHAFQGLTHI